MSFKLQNFQNGRHNEVAASVFLLEVVPEIEYTRKIAMRILSFWSTV